MSGYSEIHGRELLENFKNFYKDLNQAEIDDLEKIYDEDIIFRDPVHEIRGLNNLHSYMYDMYANVKRCHFDYLDQIVTDGRAFIKWDMTFAHAKLGCKDIVVRGITHIAFSEKITFHEDCYDMGQMLYENVPLLGMSTRWLKRRLSRVG